MVLLALHLCTGIVCMLLRHRKLLEKEVEILVGPSRLTSVGRRFYYLYRIVRSIHTVSKMLNSGGRIAWHGVVLRPRSSACAGCDSSLTKSVLSGTQMSTPSINPSEAAVKVYCLGSSDSQWSIWGQYVSMTKRVIVSQGMFCSHFVGDGSPAVRPARRS